jgi:hypothetical protein
MRSDSKTQIGNDALDQRAGFEYDRLAAHAPVLVASASFVRLIRLRSATDYRGCLCDLAPLRFVPPYDLLPAQYPLFPHGMFSIGNMRRERRIIGIIIVNATVIMACCCVRTGVELRFLWYLLNRAYSVR